MKSFGEDSTKLNVGVKVEPLMLCVFWEHPNKRPVVQMVMNQRGYKSIQRKKHKKNKRNKRSGYIYEGLYGFFYVTLGLPLVYSFL